MLQERQLSNAPLQLVPRGPVGSAAQLPAPPSADKIEAMPQVLLVDDEPRVARALEFALKGSDFAVTSISDPALLESNLLQSRPDAVLLDIGIGAEDGLAVCERIKKDVRFASIPVLLLSGQTGADTKAAGFAAGADDFITKPFSPVELIARVQAQISRRASA